MDIIDFDVTVGVPNGSVMLLVVCRGMLQFNGKGGIRVFQAGQLLLCGSGTQMDGLTVGEGCSARLLLIEQVMLDYFFLHHPVPRDLGLDLSQHLELFLEIGDMDVLLRRLSLVEELLKAGAGNWQLKHSFSLLMLEVIAGLKEVEIVDGQDVLLSELFELLELNFKRHRCTSFYARRLGVSPRMLNYLCRKWFAGSGFFQVLMARLVEEAEVLLGGELPIKAIAYELGFSSPQHFRTYFDRYRKISPSAFRANLRSGGDGANH
jgi:AraC-like DNA-binding protein